MNRKNFLKLSGLVGATAVLPKLVSSPQPEKVASPPDCTLIPSETAGPFPLDLTENTFYFRQDVRETSQGVQLNVRLKINGLENCLPMPNLRVNIWHCSNVGLYSGYSSNMNAGQAGLTYLRGYQFTDSNGEAEFITAFPGWYNGRICHIHFQVFVNSSYAAISQLTFPIDTKNALYAANPSLYPKGADPKTFASDNIFSDGHNYQLATLTPNATTGGYDTYLEVTIQGTGLVGLSNAEKETAKQLVMGQNFPNPYRDETIIPFELKQTSELLFELWDLNGKKVRTIPGGTLPPDAYELPIKMSDMGLPTGNYIYQLEIKNRSGVFRDCKMMTSMK